MEKTVKTEKASQESSKKEQKKKEVSYSKEQILASKKYRNRKDIVSAVLSGGKSYTQEEVGQAIEQFMKGKVD